MSWENDVLTNLAGRVGQMKDELRQVGNSKNISLSASHEAGVLMSYLNSVESRLIKLAGRVERNE